MTRDEAVKLIIDEYNKTEDFHSDMEGYALLKEKLDGLWDDIKRDYPGKMLADSAARMGAMALKFFNDRDKGINFFKTVPMDISMATPHEGYAYLLFASGPLWESVIGDKNVNRSAAVMGAATIEFLMRCCK